MKKSIVKGFAFALVASAIGWFVLPSSTRLETALGVILFIFVTALVVGTAIFQLTKTK